MTPITRDFSSLIGIPYEEKNCWDAVVAFQELCFGIKLTHYFGEKPDERTDIEALISSNKGDFEKVEGELQFGDLLLIRIRGIESHIAVYAGKTSEDMIFHSMQGSGSCLDRLSRWKNLINGAYRMRSSQ